MQTDFSAVKALDPRSLPYKAMALKTYLLANVESRNIPAVLELVKRDFELSHLFEDEKETTALEQAVCNAVSTMLKMVRPFLKGSGSVESHVAHGILVSLLALASNESESSNRSIANKFEVNPAYLSAFCFLLLFYLYVVLTVFNFYLL